MAQRRIIQKAMDSGVLNNTNKTHDFVDLVAKIAADKGLDFDFADSKKIREAGFGVEGLHVGGYVNGNAVTVNVQSAGALNTVVGHEITHVLEGTELYGQLQKVAFDYARSKGELPARWRSVKNRYRDADAAAVNQELTADLVGDYVFSDTDFVESLYAGDRTVFEKVYDEVKYLSRVVSAGSKEGRQLEKVKKAFADAYRVEGMKPANGEVRYKVYDRPNFTKDEWSIVNRRKHSEFGNPKYDLDAGKKFLYANEKGMTVFAIYSKDDPDDPTVLYGKNGKTAEKNYTQLMQFMEEGKEYANRNRSAFDRLLADVQSNGWRGRDSVSDAGRQGQATGDVRVPFEEPGSKRRRDPGDGEETRRDKELSEQDMEASEKSDASSLITFSNDYEAIRRFLKG